MDQHGEHWKLVSASPTERRTDLDWLRVAAFAILILYHVGMFYVTWDWHVKSPRASAAIEPLMLLANPWRLILLFIISGAATRFMADKISAAKLFSTRMMRLVPPLVLAIFVIVPPQSYLEVVSAMQEAGAAANLHWLDNFYVKYATASGHWCDGDGCLITPTYNHMWFVAYLIAYTLLLIALLPVLRRLPGTLAALIAPPVLIVAPWLFLTLLRLALLPTFGVTYAIWNDWYAHAVYFAAFLFGFGVAKHQAFFDACERQRWLALILALVAFGLLQAARNGALTAPASWGRFIPPALHELQAWAAIVAAFGFAQLHLRNADGPARRYFTDAIFPFYLIHQTAIVVFAFYLAKLALPLWIEAPTLIGLTLLACWTTYEIARRTPFLRPWFGLRSKG
jgi:peptidoglycan/LPS O-acetylase OafA/YrhL